jgi:hypothetical protein
MYIAFLYGLRDFFNILYIKKWYSNGHIIYSVQKM